MQRVLAMVAVLAGGCRCGDGGSRAPEPPQGDEGWPQVEQWARPSVAPADATLLVRAIEVLEPVRDAVERHLDAADDSGSEPQRLSAEELGPEAVEALDALVAWHEERGGIPATDCTDIATKAGNVLRWHQL